jgi:hypothetical protein
LILKGTLLIHVPPFISTHISWRLTQVSFRIVSVTIRTFHSLHLLLGHVQFSLRLAKWPRENDKWINITGIHRTRVSQYLTQYWHKTWRPLKTADVKVI